MNDPSTVCVFVVAWIICCVSCFFLGRDSKKQTTEVSLPGKVARQIRLKHKVSELSEVIQGLRCSPYWTSEGWAMAIQLAEAKAELEILTRELEGKDPPPPSGV